MIGDANHITLRELFLQAIDLPPEARQRFLDDLPPARREELAALLDLDPGSETFFERTVAGCEKPPELTGSCIGQRFGPFEAREFVGRGGMGTVLKAERVDGELAQTVAIKILERAWLDPRAVDRFRQERRFLAGFSHPNIARLIDGGTRPDGLVYLVMEYIEGLRIDRYCAEKQLSTDDRLKLFLPLCDAVDHAHQKLIIHRDLKPSNVLVTPAGEPKLIDFGVSKALDATESAGSTQTVALTPDFASPEQACGDEITIATDVYGLGAILYFLLTGKAPRAVEGMALADVRRSIREVPPAPPSTIEPALKGDLENIVLRALQGEPSRRYRSARDLAEDIENYLAHRPVRATPDSLAYRIRRFVQRNALASSAATVAVLAVLAGTGVSVYQAHRAQQRFNQVREMANQFVFDFEASIRDTPGTLEARRKMATAARRYLADLAADAGRDDSLQRELAASYFRLSQIEANAQEFDAWLEHLKQSANILKGLHDDCCGPPAQRLFYVEILADMVKYWVDRTPKEAVPIAAEALKVAKSLEADSPADARASKAMIEALIAEGMASSNVNRFEDARKSFEEGLRRAETLLQRLPGEEDLLFLRADVGNRLTSVLAMLGEIGQARDTENVSIAVLDRLIAKHPENVRWRSQKIRMAASSASLLRRAARKEPALASQVTPAYREVYGMARELAAQNPGRKDALELQFVMAARYANQLGLEHKDAEALAIHQESEKIIEALSISNPADRRMLYLRATNWTDQGVFLVGLERWREAVAMLTQSEELIQRVLTKWPEDAESWDLEVATLVHRIPAERHLGDTNAAREDCRKAFEAVSRRSSLGKGNKQSNPDIEMLKKEARILGVANPASPQDQLPKTAH